MATVRRATLDPLAFGTDELRRSASPIASAHPMTLYNAERQLARHADPVALGACAVSFLGVAYSESVGL